MDQENRVHVLSFNKKEDLGLGTYLGMTTLEDELESGKIQNLDGYALVMSREPIEKIRLDSGKIIYGCHCFWKALESV